MRLNPLDSKRNRAIHKDKIDFFRVRNKSTQPTMTDTQDETANPILTFHPGNLSYDSSSSRLRRRTRIQAYQTTHVRRQQATAETLSPLALVSSKSSSTSFFNFQTQPDLLSLLPNVPSIYKIAYAKCGTSLRLRNTYLLDFKRSMLRFGKTTRPQTPASSAPSSSLAFPAFPFEAQFQQVREWFRKEHLLRNSFRKLLYAWVSKKYSSRMLNTNDPSTLCEPECAVSVYDSRSRGMYQFEAEALHRQMNCQLGNSKWMFPEAKTPRNPLTNVPFHLGQLLEIHKQLKAYGKTSWLIECFVESKFDIPTFITTHKTALKLYALDDLMRHPSDDDFIELMEEFIEDQYEHHKFYQKAKLRTMYWALVNRTTDPYMKSWYILYRDYMKKIILFGNTYYGENMNELRKIYSRSYKLFTSPTLAVFAEDRLLTLPRNAPLPATPPLTGLTLELPIMPLHGEPPTIEGTLLNHSNSPSLPVIIHDTLAISTSGVYWNHLMTYLENFIQQLDGTDTPQDD